MVENFHAHIKTYHEKPRRNFKKFHPVWTFLQAAELIEMFSTAELEPAFAAWFK
jgi:hypothetical protein